MDTQWICTPCGLIYDQEQGRPQDGIAPGTPLHQIPQDWRCPECGASKDVFEPVPQ